ncbi:hypothetical protein HUJ05_008274 [Dendroctonus ponderosae]|nr:hypothetical protein HUJ05_008274 [Dendroctonus ponderosae]
MDGYLKKYLSILILLRSEERPAKVHISLIFKVQLAHDESVRRISHPDASAGVPTYTKTLFAFRYFAVSSTPQKLRNIKTELVQNKIGNY